MNKCENSILIGYIQTFLYNLPFVVVVIKHQMDWNNQLVLKTDPYRLGNVNVTFVVNTLPPP